jgi:uncharacterized peroxidase-related enzyme
VVLLAHTNPEETPMPRIEAPAIESTPAASQPLLAAVKKQLGTVPNLFRTVAHSPAALEGYLGLNGALAKGSLGAATRERIALAVAEFNGCDYCLAAHSYIGKNLAKLSDAEIEANRRGRSTDAKADAAVVFAVKVVSARGQVSAADVSAVRAAGLSEADIIEIIAHVALNTLTNYVNVVAETVVDFPAAPALKAA